MSHIVVLSGAGISADSGLATFRDSGGLWETHDITEIASIEGWYRNKEKVLKFYNKRREQLSKAKPNAGHIAIANLEKDYDVTVVTQNVDNLHERAGSTNVMHLHGLLTEARSENDPELITEIGTDPIKLGDKASDGSQLRPNVVWFGEPVPMIEKAATAVMNAEIFIVVGTSLAVYPAASLVHYVDDGIPKFLVDPAETEMRLAEDWDHIKERAEVGLPKLAKQLLNNL
ncbi:MAG: Sir2 family NAD-dependent protein deacetylase [Balneolaceae bacterium]|nr:Sir2 family NAD-dependent protein deacetylase [Balneolaceae bacterium]